MSKIHVLVRFHFHFILSPTKCQTYIPPNMKDPKNNPIGTVNTAKCNKKEIISRPLSPHPKPKAIDPKTNFKSIISLFMLKKSYPNNGLSLNNEKFTQC